MMMLIILTKFLFDVWSCKRSSGKYSYCYGTMVNCLTRKDKIYIRHLDVIKYPQGRKRVRTMLYVSLLS